MNFEQLLKFAVDHNASDIHLQAGLVPAAARAVQQLGASIRGFVTG